MVVSLSGGPIWYIVKAGMIVHIFFVWTDPQGADHLREVIPSLFLCPKKLNAHSLLQD